MKVRLSERMSTPWVEYNQMSAKHCRNVRGQVLVASTALRETVKVLDCEWVECWRHVFVVNEAKVPTTARRV